MNADTVKQYLKTAAENNNCELVKYDGRQQYFHLQAGTEKILGFCHRKADFDYATNRVESALKYGTRI
jgi:hypothetical protein